MTAKVWKPGWLMKPQVDCGCMLNASPTCTDADKKPEFKINFVRPLFTSNVTTFMS